MWCRPVSASASIRRILSAVLIGPGSIWKPSRGPSSWISTCFGRSVMGAVPGSRWALGNALGYREPKVPDVSILRYSAADA